ncbi:hypothetical protein BHM03_00030861 [Ensete ventricosum]|nr:hypothetical protein BHM03_00030861 [Ensete ventricosum]
MLLLTFCLDIFHLEDMDLQDLKGHGPSVVAFGFRRAQGVVRKVPFSQMSLPTEECLKDSLTCIRASTGRSCGPAQCKGPAREETHISTTEYHGTSWHPGTSCPKYIHDLCLSQVKSFMAFKMANIPALIPTIPLKAHWEGFTQTERVRARAQSWGSSIKGCYAPSWLSRSTQHLPDFDEKLKDAPEKSHLMEDQLMLVSNELVVIRTEAQEAKEALEEE